MEEENKKEFYYGDYVTGNVFDDFFFIEDGTGSVCIDIEEIDSLIKELQDLKKIFE